MRSALCLLLVMACGDDPPGKGPDPRPTTPTVTTPDVPTTAPRPDQPDYEPLSPVRRLVRASLDLRGVRPSPDEIAAVEADSSVVDALITGFVNDDPRFVERMRWLAADLFWTYDTNVFIGPMVFEPRFGRRALYRSVGEEPLRAFARVVDEDMPLSELVTGDWTMANDVLADLWPVERHTPDADGWFVSRYTDGRPPAGVLSMTSLWWHQGSMENNVNRGRANFVSRLFLCYDYLDLQVDFGTDQPLSSDEALGDAVRTDPNCTVCHETLDPLASHFFGFWFFGTRKANPYDVTHYHRDREREWADYDMPAPGFAGEPTAGLADLGQRIAEHPRFAQCFVEHSWRMLLRRSPLAEESALVAAQAEAFREGGLVVRPLVTSIALSGPYADGHSDMGRKVADAALLSSMVEDLTGYRLESAELDRLRAPFDGQGQLLGAVDGTIRFDPAAEPDTTYTLVTKRLAEAAAAQVVAHDLADPRTARLLTLVDRDTTPASDPAAMASQLVALHLRILSQRVGPADPAIDEELVLWDEVVRRTGDPADGWTAVISLLLRDPELVIY